MKRPYSSNEDENTSKMNLSSTVSKQLRASFSSTSTSSDRSGRRKVHKAKKSRSIKHVVVLPNGARLTKSNTKKYLRDGSLFVATKLERVDAASSSDYKEGGARIIKTETQRIRPDGYNITTATTKTIDTASWSRSRGKQNNHAETKILPDGTRVVKSTTQTLRPDGKLDTVRTTVRIMKPPTDDSSLEENLKQFDLVSGSKNRPKVNLPMPPISEAENVVQYHPSSDQEDNASEVFPEVDYSYEAQSSPRIFVPHSSSDEAKVKTMRFGNKRTGQGPEIVDNVSEPKPPEFIEKNGKTKHTNPSTSTTGAHRSSTRSEYKLFNLGMHPIGAAGGISHSRQNHNRMHNLEMDYSNNPPIPPEFVKSSPLDKANMKMQRICGGTEDRVLEINDSIHEPIPPEYVLNDPVNERNPLFAKMGMKLGGIFSHHTSRDDKKSISQYSESNRVAERAARDTMSSKPKSSHSSASMETDEKSKGRFSVNSIYLLSNDRSTKGSGIQSMHSSIDTRSKTTASCFPDEELPVAKAVDRDEGGNKPIYSAIEYDPFSKPPIYANRRFRVYVAFALLIICIVTAVVVVYATREVVTIVMEVDERANGTFTPTLPPTTIRDTLGIREHIESHVLQRNATFKTIDHDDPRERAMQWLLHDDAMQLDTLDENVSQRYVMALLAFSLDSEAWQNCGSYAVNDGAVLETCLVEDNSTGFAVEYSSWLSSADECDWYGVTCVDGYVRWIELPDNDLIGRLVPEIGSLKYLQILYLIENCIYGTIPPELGKLKYLEQLDLSWNGLNGNFPEEIFDATSLVKLNVGYQWNDWNCTRSDGTLGEIMYIMGDSENDVNYGLYGSILDSRIGQLQNLRELTIAENSFSGQIASELGNLQQLVNLDIGYNSMNGTIPKEVTNLINLRNLNLDENWMSGEIPSAIGSLKHLEVLTNTNLNNEGNMTGSIPDSFYNLTDLKYFYIAGNKLNGTISPDIGNLKSLERLLLNNNAFSGTLPTELGLCKELEVLKFHATNISGTVPDEVCLLRKENLNLNKFGQFFQADCSPSNETKAPFIYCKQGCCQTCCDHVTSQCIILE